IIIPMKVKVTELRKTKIPNIIAWDLEFPILEFLISVILWLKWSFNRHTYIVRLLIAKLGQLNTDFFQVQFGNFFIQMLWQHIHFVFVRISIGPQLNLRQSLVCKRVTHYKTRMSSGTSQIH